MSIARRANPVDPQDRRRLPEDDFNGYLTEHGYASNTPTSDGERVYVFFGKSGVFAFDIEGKKLWSAHVGKESSDRRWGSAASLILCDDALIVNASEESNSLRALDKADRPATLEERSQAARTGVRHAGPRHRGKGKSDLVLAVPGEVWGLDPNRGKLRWRVETQLMGNICPSPVVDGDTGLRLWRRAFVGKLCHPRGGQRRRHRVERRLVEPQQLVRLDSLAFGRASLLGRRPRHRLVRESGSGCRGLSAAGGRPANGRTARVRVARSRQAIKILAVTRWDGTLVLPASPSFKLLAQNRFRGDDTDFNATPALSDSEFFSDRIMALYCVCRGKVGPAHILRVSHASGNFGSWFCVRCALCRRRGGRRRAAPQRPPQGGDDSERKARPIATTTTAKKVRRAVDDRPPAQSADGSSRHEP